MMTELQSGLSVDSCHMKTFINVSTYIFNWTIENFSKLPSNKTKKSPTFHVSTNDAFYATLRVDETSGGYGFLEFHHISGTRIEVKHNVSIENSAGKVILKHNKTHTYGDHSNAKCDVLPPCRETMKRAREENVLILKCVMEFYEEDETDAYFYKSYSKPVSLLDNLSVLSNELKAIYDKLMYADVSLKVGDNTVHAHKLIICARSSVFARMFETPMGEREENVINITDLDLPVLKDLVSYLYTGMLAKDDFESVYALYYAADKYDVSSLRKTCGVVLLSKLDVENASRVLALADQHSDVELKNSVMNFIKFCFDKVLESDAWDELVKNAPRLATEAISAWSKNHKNIVKTDTT